MRWMMMGRMIRSDVVDWFVEDSIWETVGRVGLAEEIIRSPAIVV